MLFVCNLDVERMKVVLSKHGYRTVSCGLRIRMARKEKEKEGVMSI